MSPAASPTTGTRRASDEHEDLAGDDEMERDQKDQVRHVGAESEDPEHQAVDDDRRAKPVLVERAEEAPDVERATFDHRPLVGEERQALAEGQENDSGDRGGENEQRAAPGPLAAAPNVLDLDAPPGRSRRRTLRPG